MFKLWIILLIFMVSSFGCNSYTNFVLTKKIETSPANGGTAVNDAPTMSSVANQVINEDTSTSALPVTIGDVDNTLSCTNLTASSSNTTLIPSSNIVIGGVSPNCTVTVTPGANQNGGPVTITLSLTDGTNITTSTFTTTVTAVNDAPTMSSVANQVINEDTSTSALPVTIGDVDNTLSCTNLTASSSNTTLIPSSNIVIGGVSPNCTVTVTPGANQNGGPVTITLSLTDGTNITTSTFTTTVTAVNDAPTMSSVANQVINEDTSTSALPVTIGDVDNTLSCTNLTASSSNTTLIPSSNIVIGGVSPNCTVTVTPGANQNGGPVTITLSLTDGTNITTSTFTTTVTAVNDAPTMSSVANQVINEDTSTSALPVTIGDVDNTLSCTNLTASSSNTTLIPSSNIVIGGVSPNCTVTVTPGANQNGGPVTITLSLTDGTNITTSTFTTTVTAVNDAPTMSSVANQVINEDTSTSALPVTIGDVDNTLSCTNLTASSSNTTLIPSSNIVIGGVSPNCTVTVTPGANQNGGPVTITLSLTDGTNITTSTFTTTVTAVNDAPTMSSVANQVINEDTSTSALPVTIGDVDNTLSCTNLTASSSNTTLIPSSNIVIGGVSPNCTVTVTPGANQNGGPVTITLSLTDGTNITTSTFTTTVTAVNDAPTMSSVANQVINEDTSTSALPVTIGDVDNTLSCTNLTASSSNTTLIPSSNIVIGGVSPNCTVTVTPGANQNGGPVTITLSLTDGTNITTSTFTTTVTAVNDAPTMSSVANQVINEDTSTSALPVTIGDVDNTLSCTNLTASSSNTTLIPSSNIVIGGVSPNCTVTVTPGANQNGGPVTITLSLTDGTNITTSTFTTTVTAVNDAPTMSSVANQVINEDTSTSALPVTIGDVDNTLSCTNLTASSSNTTLIPSSNIVIGGVSPNCTVTVTPGANQNGGPVTITLSLTDGTNITTSTFTTTVTAVNDAPTMSSVANQVINEDTSTSALPVTIGDVDNTLSCTNLTASSSNTTLIPSSNIVIGGVSPNCTVTVTPGANQNGGPVTITLSLTDGTNITTSTFTTTVTAVNDAPTMSSVANQVINEDTSTSALPVTIGDVDNTLSCTNLTASSSNTTLIPSSNIVIGGVSPNCTVTVTPGANQNGGPVTITLSLTDGTNITTSTFTTTVTAVNDAPTMSSVANQVINEDTSTSALPVTIGDVDNTLSCTNLTASSSNTTLIPSSNIVIGGVSPNCTVTVTPGANQNGGPVTITLSLTDGTNITTSTFTTTVTAVNDAPTMSSVANQVINSNSSTGPIGFTIGDVDSILLCSSVNISAISNNTTLLSNSNIIIDGVYPNCTVSATPTTGQSGVSTITLTVYDNGTPNLQATTSFLLNVKNQSPTISSIADQSISKNTSTGNLSVIINDVDNVLSCSNITASSDNQSIVNDSDIVIKGTAPNCTVNINPIANTIGNVNISLKVTDGFSMASTIFKLIINEECNIISFNSDSLNILYGNQTNLNWKTSDCKTTAIYPNIGNVTPVDSGSIKSGAITKNTKFTLVTNYQILSGFNAKTDGSNPVASLILSPDGSTLYGTTQYGGGNGVGTLFSYCIDATNAICANGTQTPLYSFTGGTDGSNPMASLILSPDGSTLYGTTQNSGDNGVGTLFSYCIDATNAICANGTQTPLYSFTGGTDGSNPVASLILSPDGSTLYGTTQNGGDNRAGTLFSYCIDATNAICANGTQTPLYSFMGGTDGSNPVASLILSPDGSTLYGTTQNGGDNRAGTLFSYCIDATNAICANGTQTPLYSFMGGTDGSNPVASLILSPDGSTLYGTTQNGGDNRAGTLFSYCIDATNAICANGTQTPLYSFMGGTDGSNPVASLILSPDGSTLYGTTQNGGDNRAGTLFSYCIDATNAICANGTQTPLYSFMGGTDGSNPVASLIFTSGYLYGTTQNGGDNGAGTLFSIDSKSKHQDIFITVDGKFPLVFTGGGPAGSADLVGGAIGPDGKIYVSDVTYNLINIFDASGNYIKSIGAGALNFPIGVAVTTNGNIYVASASNYEIVVFDSSGNHINSFNSGGGVPEGIALDPITGNIVVSFTYGTGLVSVFSPAGIFIQNYNNYFINPEQITFDSAGNLYVANHTNNAFVDNYMKINRNTGAVTVIATAISLGINYVDGIAVDTSNNIYVGNATSSKLVKLDQNGNVIWSIDAIGPGLGQFLSGIGYIYIKGDLLLVSDRGNHRIQAFDLNGNPVVIYP